MAVLLCFGERREQHMAAKRDAPELWEQQEGEKSQHYQKFCQYRDMPYGTQGREPEKKKHPTPGRRYGNEKQKQH